MEDFDGASFTAYMPLLVAFGLWKDAKILVSEVTYEHIISILQESFRNCRTSTFIDCMSFLMPNEQHQSTSGKQHIKLLDRTFL